MASLVPVMGLLARESMKGWHSCFAKSNKKKKMKMPKKEDRDEESKREKSQS